jgi:hypothetical protein
MIMSKLNVRAWLSKNTMTEAETNYGIKSRQTWKNPGNCLYLDKGGIG